MKKYKPVKRAIMLAFVMLAALLLPLFGNAAVSVSAISTDYPVPLFNLAVKDNSKSSAKTVLMIILHFP